MSFTYQSERSENISYYKGKLLTEMTREELIAAVEFLGTAFHRQIEQNRKERDFWRSIKRPDNWQPRT